MKSDTATARHDGTTQASVLLRVEKLRTHFHTRAGVVRAVDGVSLSVKPGEVVGVVGESGCGKTVLCLSLMGLIASPPGSISYTALEFDGRKLDPGNERSMREIRGNSMSMIFQDPMTSLNPFMRIGAQIAEPLIIHRGIAGREAQRVAREALGAVGITDPERGAAQYPHEFSGGMRQRVSIAMALVSRPKLFFADEPTTALDVTVQAQILALLKDLQAREGAAVVFITHDFGIVAGLCDRVLVMYAGRVVESGKTRELFTRPLHPYTRALLRALPARAPAGGQLYTIPGQPPDLGGGLNGCTFAPRCEYAAAACGTHDMSLRAIESTHCSACLRIRNGEIPEL